MLSVFLPKLCISCGETSAASSDLGSYLCERCLRILDASESPIEDDIRSRLERVLDSIDFGVVRSSYAFQTESVTQSLIHGVKYTGMPRLGRMLGRRFAAQHT